MAIKKYLDNTGLSRFKDKIVALIPTRTSQLTNNSDFVSDANYVHTDNNFNNTYKGEVDSLYEIYQYEVVDTW